MTIAELHEMIACYGLSACGILCVGSLAAAGLCALAKILVENFPHGEE